MDFLEGLIYVIWRGFAIGVIISAPMGPVGILCVQRTLEKGRRVGLLTGVGAALSDLFYCLLTGFGLSFIEEFLKDNQNIIQIIGSVVLVLFGVYLFRSNPARTLKKPGEERASKGKTVLSGFLFTFSNPLIIFLIIGLFARFNFLLPEISFLHYIVGFASIIAGALVWWWIVTFFVDKVRSHFNLRSMWLINKITGVIIMIFAVVGVVTAVTNMAGAATLRPVCLNSGRGFGALDPNGMSPAEQPLRIESDGPDTITRFLPVAPAEDFSFSFRCANLHNAPDKTYAWQDIDGKRRKSKFMPWGLVLAGNEGRYELEFRTVDDRFDPLIPSAVEVKVSSPGTTAPIYRIISGMDFFTGWNAYRIVRTGEGLELQAGNRSYESLFPALPPVPCDSIGFRVYPGGAIELDEICLNTLSEREPTDRNSFSHFADSNVRNSYFARSADGMEGVWEVFDHMLDDKNLRMGGNYKVALVKTASGYQMVYLDGARAMAPRWRPGMTKGELRSTDFRNVYDVCWLDPQGRQLGGEVKAQLESSGILAFQFPEHGASVLRLRKIKENGERNR